MQLHNKIDQKSIDGVSQPIKYPTNIVIDASPIYPYIKNPELSWQLNFIPYSNGNTKNSPYAAESVIPSIIDEMYEAAKYIPKTYVKTSTTAVKPIWPKIKILSFLEAFSLTKAKTNLNIVIKPQNNELNIVAPCLVVTPFRTE